MDKKIKSTVLLLFAVCVVFCLPACDNLQELPSGKSEVEEVNSTIAREDLTEPTVFISADSKSVAPGSTVKITIAVENNPGIAMMRMGVKFNESVLTLKDIAYKFKDGNTQLPPSNTSPVVLLWYNGNDNTVTDGAFAELTFTVNQDAAIGNYSEIKLIINPNEITDINEAPVAFVKSDGRVSVE